MSLSSKIIFSFVAAGMGLLFAGRAVPASAATLSLSPSSGSRTVGDIFPVALLLNTQSLGVAGVDILYLNYNPSLLEVQDDDATVAGVQIAPGSLMPQTIVNVADATNGRISFSQIANIGGPGFSGSGTLATARFKARAPGVAAVTFTFAAGGTTDANVASAGADALTAVTNGNYTLTSSVSSPAPSAPSPAPSSGGGGGGFVAPTPSATAAPVPAPTPSASSFVQSTNLPSGVREGDLVRGPDGIKVYIVNQHGYRRHIFNPAVFSMYGHFKWDQIKTLDQQTMDSLKTSDFYRADGDTRVFSLKELDERQGLAEKRWMNIAGERFTQFGYSWNQVFIINAKERDYYQEGSPLEDAELSGAAPLVRPGSGSLVKTAGSSVIYYITPAGLKKPIPSLAVFNSYNNKWENVKTIGTSILDSYPTVRAIKLSTSQKVYLIENNQKRWVSTEAAFTKLGLVYAEVATVNQTELNAYAEGEAVR